MFEPGNDGYMMGYVVPHDQDPEHRPGQIQWWDDNLEDYGHDIPNIERINRTLGDHLNQGLPEQPYYGAGYNEPFKLATVEPVSGDAWSADQLWTNDTQRYPLIHDERDGTTYVGDLGKHHTTMMEIMGYNPMTRWDQHEGWTMGAAPLRNPGHIQWFGGDHWTPEYRSQIESELRQKMGWPNPANEWDFATGDATEPQRAQGE
jgi:hypothetical protein